MILHRIVKNQNNHRNKNKRTHRWRTVFFRTDEAITKEDLIRRILTEALPSGELNVLKKKQRHLNFTVCFVPTAANNFTWELFRKWLKENGLKLQIFESYLWIMPENTTTTLDNKMIQKVYEHLRTYTGEESLVNRIDFEISKIKHIVRNKNLLQ